ncbi:MAG: secretin N-terminal domain-containing protein [Verrucomicrobiota bacterium]
MKTKLAFLLAVGLTSWGLVCSAQNTNPDKKAESPPAAEAPPAEIVPLITFDETPIADVIKTLARQAGINYVMAPDAIKGGPVDPATGVAKPPPPISIRFENVTAEAAFTKVLENHGMEYVPDPKTKIGTVRAKDPKALEPLFTKVVALRYANPTNVVSILTPTLSTRSKVQADVRTSKLIILATEKELEQIDTLLKELDTITQQILIEARIFESTRNPSTIKGIDWTGTLQAQQFGFGNGITTGEITTTRPGATTSTTTTLPGGRTITSTSSGPATETSSLITSIGTLPGLTANTAGGFSPGIAFLNADGIRGVLSFLNSDSDTEVVAEPRTVTTDNTKARLSVTRSFPIFTVTPGSANTPATAQITYTNVGTILEVTPRISGQTNIALRVAPEVSNIDSKDRQIISGDQFEANVYAIRRIETDVLIPSGDTLVMGGLISDNLTTRNTKVPFLGDLPGLKRVFGNESKVRNKQHLIIFVTPTIVQDHDFQYVPSNFLRTPYQEKPDEEWNAWDSAKPTNWGKSK